MRRGMMRMALGSLGLALCAGCMGPAAEPEPASTAESGLTASEATEAGVVLRIEVERGHTVTGIRPRAQPAERPGHG